MPNSSSDVELVTDKGQHVGQLIKLRKCNLSECTTEPICRKMKQLAYRTRPLGNIGASHVHELRESFQ